MLQKQKRKLREFSMKDTNLGKIGKTQEYKGQTYEYTGTTPQEEIQELRDARRREQQFRQGAKVSIITQTAADFSKLIKQIGSSVAAHELAKKEIEEKYKKRKRQDEVIPPTQNTNDPPLKP